MKKAALSFLVFAGCFALPAPQPHIDELLVYKDQYIVDATEALQWCDGPTFEPGDCQIEENEKTFLVTPIGGLAVIRSAGEAPMVPYDPNKDLCLLQGLDDCSPNWVHTIDRIPNDPDFRKLWGLESIRAPEAWDTSTGGGVKVAVIDTGVNCDDHPDLVCAGQYDAIKNQPKQIDDNGHGSHVAGTIAASGDNHRGVVGVNWSVSLLAGKFLKANGSGSTYHAVRAIDWAVENGAQVINNSWGGGGYSKPLHDALKRACDAGAIIVNAAGNSSRDNDSMPHYPANYDLPCSLSVASVTKFDTLSSFSNYGSTSVDLGAPGTQIYSTYRQGYKTLSGTSMASPHVSGAVALLISAGHEADPAVDRILASTRTTSSLTGKTKTGGVLDLFAALGGCDRPRFIECRNECRERYLCAYRKQRRCRKECRQRYNCGGDDG